ncbi:MAG: ParB/RepB/Spo0J family partition protein [Planctomycetota bacterium]|nr:ParB/RepB/Spo0J family partition protein [Planctomycetota bacterium]
MRKDAKNPVNSAVENKVTTRTSVENDPRSASTPQPTASQGTPLSRLGRGLGRLIPVAIPRFAGEAQSAPAPNSVVSRTPAVVTPVAAAPTAEPAAAPAVLATPLSVGLSGTPQSTVVATKPARTVEVKITGSAVSSSSTRSTQRGTAATGDQPEPSAQAVQNIAIQSIRANPLQPRTIFTEPALAELAASISQAGLIQPIIVRQQGTGFELVAGERRWRAAQKLGWTVIPAIVREVSQEESGYWSLIENVQREELNPMDRAEGMARLRDRFGLTQAILAERLGSDRASVANLLRLLDLDPATANMVRVGSLTFGHAKVLAGVSDTPTRKRLADRCVVDGWSVRGLENEVRSGTHTATPKVQRLPITKSVSAHIATLERELGDHLGTRVAIRLGRKSGTGKLTLEFFSLDQFDGLMEKMGYQSKS